MVLLAPTEKGPAALSICAPLGLSPEWEIVAQSSGLRHRLGTCSKGGGTTVFTKRENTRGCPQFAHTLCSTGRLHHPVAR